MKRFLLKVLGTLTVVGASVTGFSQSTTSLTSAGTYTFTVPDGVTSITVEAWGGGGGGGGTAASPSAGGGGGGGAYASSVLSVTPNTDYTVVVGAGGLAGTNTGGDGGTGGTSSFGGTLVVAGGGTGGGGGSAINVYGAGGAGGTTATGNATFFGGSGAGASTGLSGAGGGGSSAGNASNGNSATGNIGGAAVAGGGAGASNTGTTSSGVSGSTGSAPGGGGSGGRRSSSTTARTGGSGGSGRVVITYNCVPTTTFPNSETFSIYLPPCWEEGDGGTLTSGPTTISASAATAWLADGFANSSTAGAARATISSTTDNDWLISTSYNIPATGSYELNYSVAATQSSATTAPTTAWENDDTVQVLISTTGTTGWTVLTSYHSLNVPSDVGQLDAVSLSAYAGQTVRFAVRVIEGTADGTASIDFFVDNFGVAAVNLCETPTQVSVSNINPASVNVNFTSTGSNFIVEYGPSGFTPGTGASPGSGTLVAGSSSPIILTGLSPTTTYQVYVRQVCAGPAYSGNSIPDVFTTPCAAITSLPSSEPFNTYLPSTCWLEGDAGDPTNGPAVVSASAATAWIADGFSNIGSTGAARANIASDIDNDWLISPFYTIPAGGTFQVVYDVAATQTTSSTAPTTPWESDDYVQLLVSTGNTNWAVIKTYDHLNVPAPAGQTDAVNLSAYAGQTVNFAFRVVEGPSDGSASIDFFVDNFTVAELIACSGTPTAGTPSSTSFNICPNTTATISVTGGSANNIGGIVRQWDSSASASGPFFPVMGGSGGTSTTYVTAPFAGTDVYYRLRVTCTNSGLDDNTASVLIAPPPAPATQASALSAVSQFSNSGALSFTAGSGDVRLVYLNTINSFTPPAAGATGLTASTTYSGSGQQLVYASTATSVTVSGLSPGTTYYAVVYEAARCGSGVTAFYYANASVGAGNQVQFTTPVPPANDAPCAAFAINVAADANSCSPTAVNTTGATQSPSGTSSCLTSSNNDDVWYSFTAPATGNVVIAYSNLVATVGSATSLGMDLFSGTCSTLTPTVPTSCITSFGASGTGSRSISNLTPNETYYLLIATQGTSNSGSFDLCVYDFIPPPPSACATNSAPADMATSVNTVPTLSWSAVPNATAYDVYLDINNPPTTLIGTAVGTTSFVATGLNGNTQYFWYVVPKNSGGSVSGCQNTNVTSFTTAPGAGNDNAANAIGLTLNGGCTGGDAAFTNAGATQSPGEPFAECDGVATGNKTVWFSFVAPASGFVKLTTDTTSVTGGLTNTRLAVFSATNVNDYSTFTSLACDDDNGTTQGSRSTLYLPGLTPNQTYYVQVDNSSGNTEGTFCMQVQEMTPDMLATSASCATGQSLSTVNNSYRGWMTLTTSTGLLIANVRNTAGTTGTSTYGNGLNINSGAVRQESGTSGMYYLDRNYRITNTTVPGPIDVRFFFLNSELAALTSADPSATVSNLNVTRQTSTACQANFDPAAGAESLLPQNASGSTPSVSYVEVTTPSFSNFYVHAGAVPLYTEFTSVFATNAGSRNRVDWGTGKEDGGDQFEVQRSANGRDFMTLWTVPARAAASAYTFWDEKPLAGINYYRIHAVGVSGRNGYSKVVTASVATTAGTFGLQAFPNPVTDMLTVVVGGEVKGEARLTLADATGRVLSVQRLSRSQQSFNLQHLPAGLYLVRYTDGTRTETSKVTKQ